MTTINNDIKQNIKEMSILIAKYGLSFMIHKENQKKFFEYSLTFSNPVLLLNKIYEIIEERPVLEEHFDKIKLIHHNRLNTLIPLKFFEPDTVKDWLSHQIKIPSNASAAYDYIDNLKAYNVYVPFQNLEKPFSKQTDNLTIKHSASEFFYNIRQVKNKTTDLPIFEVFLNVFPGDFQIAVFKNDRLQAYNHFDYENVEEFLYFLFFMIETLEVKPYQTQLYVFGVDKVTELYKNMLLFIKNIRLVPKKNPGQIYNYF